MSFLSLVCPGQDVQLGEVWSEFIERSGTNPKPVKNRSRRRDARKHTHSHRFIVKQCEAYGEETEVNFLCSASFLKSTWNCAKSTVSIWSLNLRRFPLALFILSRAVKGVIYSIQKKDHNNCTCFCGASIMQVPVEFVTIDTITY